MITSRKKIWMTATGFLAVSVLCAQSAGTTPDQKTDKVAINRSVFIQPSNPKEGRDPFFPDSQRPYEAALASNHNAVELSALIFKGISGTSDHRLAIINNHTFADGDEEDVLTAQGRIHVRCLQIKAYSVVIEVVGQRHELSFSGMQ